IHQFAHVADCLLQPDEYRLADAVVADIELGELGNGGDRLDVVVGQAVAGVRLDSVLRRQSGHVGDPAQLYRNLFAGGMRVFAGVKLDHRRPESQRRLELSLLWSDEQAHADARVEQARDDGLQVVVLPGRIEPTLGGAFLALLGHDAGGMRAVAQGDLDHFFSRRHLEVERQIGRLLDPLQVLVTDVPAVLAQVGGNPVAADARDDLRSAHGVGVIAAASVPDRGDVIDVDAEAQPAGHYLRLPGLTAGLAASSGGTSSSA